MHNGLQRDTTDGEAEALVKNGLRTRDAVEREGVAELKPKAEPCTVCFDVLAKYRMICLHIVCDDCYNDIKNSLTGICPSCDMRIIDDDIIPLDIEINNEINEIKNLDNIYESILTISNYINQYEDTDETKEEVKKLSSTRARDYTMLSKVESEIVGFIDEQSYVVHYNENIENAEKTKELIKASYSNIRKIIAADLDTIEMLQAKITSIIEFAKRSIVNGHYMNFAALIINFNNIKQKITKLNEVYSIPKYNIGYSIQTGQPYIVKCAPPNNVFEYCNKYILKPTFKIEQIIDLYAYF
jgi:hypothetical protein